MKDWLFYGKIFLNQIRNHGLKNTVIKLQKKLFKQKTNLNIVQPEIYVTKKELSELVAFISESNNYFVKQFLAPQQSHQLISIIMATWNRGSLIENAIKSVLQQTYKNWELIIVDDGGTDNTASILQNYLTNKRIQYFQRSHEGVSATRNFGLSKSKGEIITYLDSDNTWHSDYLTIVANAFQNPNNLCFYTATLIKNEPNVKILYESFDLEKLYKMTNYIDLNVFSHHRKLWEIHGGFDENLTRLVDLDLILRYTKNHKPSHIPSISSFYGNGKWPRIFNSENLHYNAFLIQKKYDQKISQPLKVLYVLWHYPQLTESYVQTEIEYMQRCGVEVAVWSEMSTMTAPFIPNLPVFYTKLTEAIEKFKPDLLHSHWLHPILNYANELEEFNLPITIRGHGFDYNQKVISQISNIKALKRIYLFPHYANNHQSEKISGINVAFNPELFYPNYNKDFKLILRTSAGLMTKDLEKFFQVAKHLSKYKFILVMGRCLEREEVIDYFINYNNKLGNPVDLRINLQRHDVAELMRQAGIYLHTHGTSAPFGMPISIAEAMATGCYILAALLPGIHSYLGNAGATYSNINAAIKLITSTENWSQQQWRTEQIKAIDQAYQYYVDRRALAPIVNDWQKLVIDNASKNLTSFADTINS